VAPSRAAAVPAAYGTSGRRYASTNIFGVRKPRDSTGTRRGVAGTPGQREHVARLGPAADHRRRPRRSPSAVTATVSVGLADMSPPTTLAPTSAASADSPPASSSAQHAPGRSGAQGDQQRRRGGAHGGDVGQVRGGRPVPTSAALDQSRRKCRALDQTSVDATTRPSGA
jgi:hypothetical protein